MYAKLWLSKSKDILLNITLVKSCNLRCFGKVFNFVYK